MPLESGHIQQQHGHAQACVAPVGTVTVGPKWIAVVTTLSVYKVCRTARERIPKAQPASGARHACLWGRQCSRAVPYAQ